MLKLKNINLIRTSSHYRSDTLKRFIVEAILSPIKSLTSRSATEFFLKDISLSVAPGERVALLGKNGSGKSTLCRLLASQLYASSGQFDSTFNANLFSQIDGSFFAELTGRENLRFFIKFIYHDLSPPQKTELLQAAVEFSELGSAIDRQVETYSTGMLSRLALSLILAKKHDLLILDEMHSHADINFREKVSKRLADVINASNTVIMVSHYMDEIIDVCTRGIVLDNGKIIFDGKIDKAVAYYKLVSGGQSV